MPLILLILACKPPAPGAPAGDGAGDTAPDTAPDTASTCRAPQGSPSLDSYGGDSRVELDATGYFTLTELCGRWWLLTPEGHPTWSLGVNTITPDGDTNRETGEQAYADTVNAAYADHDAWADATAARLRGWGLNTAGSWSRTALLAPRMPSMPNLGLSGSDWQTGEISDWFDPAWEAAVQATVDATVTDWVAEPNLIGWFLDNEIRWGPDWRGGETLLELYLVMPADAPGKARAVDLLLAELGDVDGVNAALSASFADREAMLEATEGWGALAAGSSETEAALTTAFLELAAERYFSATTAIVRAADPNHLVMGNREVSVMTRLEVWEAAARHVDVLSANNYVFVDGVAELAMTRSGAPDPANGFEIVHAATGMPMLISEFGFRADDSGLPNSWPPIYPTCDTQEERALAYAEYARAHHAVPWMVGLHWFEWVDQPSGGRFDGEDNNWGLVNEQDAVYTELTLTMTEVNAELWALLELPE